MEARKGRRGRGKGRDEEEMAEAAAGLDPLNEEEVRLRRGVQKCVYMCPTEGGHTDCGAHAAT